jgi:hypothetical protein
MSLEKFWNKVNKTSSVNGCWEWIGTSVHPFGYGRIGHNGKNYLSHRLSYELHYGPITSKECVLHKCDNPKCVNPSHLFIGNRADNAQDRTKKGRTNKGSQVTTSIFSEQQVRDIKMSTKTTKELAIEYNAKYQTIWSIRKGINWRHI